ncbi:MAG: homocysteine S-methyltransferase family protein [Candidatus Hatepunaea meridiana]|nr:homocysteine S-methyltransferase family protein [Candidatus Hatepunaea meridiana]
MSRTKSEDSSVRNELSTLLSERILIVDGATGTALDRLNPSEEDYGGQNLIGCNEALNLYAPHLVDKIHQSYIEVGADLIKTNSFNGSRIVLEEYGLARRTPEIARLAAEIAKKSIDKYAQGRHVYILGSMGPGTKSITVTGGVTFNEIVDVYKEYASGLLEGGVDLLLLETVQDTLNLKAALIGVGLAQKELDRDAPVAVSVTIEKGGTMLAGQNIEALYHTLSGFNLFSLGLNCATGPARMTDHLRTLARLSRFSVSLWPNAGMPDEDGIYSESPQAFGDIIGRFAREGYLNLTGGCCGTTPEHIRHIRNAVVGVQPRRLVGNGHFPALAGAEAMVVETDNRPVFVGERTNTIGSRKFKRLIAWEKWNEAAEIGRMQVRKGAMVIDLCTADPDRDEVSDYINVLRPLLRKVRVPVMLDTTDPEVVEAAFKSIGGKPAVNSVNLEDGGARLRKIAALAKEYGASLICGLIDDDPEAGMAVTLERKLEIAAKIYRILKGEFSIPDQDIVLDPLVFPAGTGDSNYFGAGRFTIEAITRIKELYPDCITILGISNVSFGLPIAGREVVNSVFLYECSKAGLDMAIVNTQRLKRYPSISDEEIKLAEDILFKGDPEAITAFTQHFREVKVDIDEDEWKSLPPAERISRAIIEARRTGLKENLDSLLKESTSLEIINGPLMRGMAEVGRLFSDNRLIVAEVLESAEVMKIAIDHLKSSRSDTPVRQPTSQTRVSDLPSVSRLDTPVRQPTSQTRMSDLPGVSRLDTPVRQPTSQTRVSDLPGVGELDTPTRLDSKAKMLLATVKGDVHDIGKNLVDMIMSNNGFEVVNLGIKVTPEAIIEAVREHNPDIIGLSGLLVRSAQQMVHTASDLSAAGIDIPLIVGGAALTKKFTLTKIAPAYKGSTICCQGAVPDSNAGVSAVNHSGLTADVSTMVFYASDAMDGLAIANKISDPDKFPQLVEKWEAMRIEIEEKGRISKKHKPSPIITGKQLTWTKIKVPEPPHFDEHILYLSNDEAFDYINPQMLYGKHLGIKGPVIKLQAAGDAKLAKLQKQVMDVFNETKSEGILAPDAIYRWFKAWPEGEHICVQHPDIGEVERFYFPPRKSGDRLSAADWLRPLEHGGDSVALFVTTSGEDVALKATQMRDEGRLLDSHILQSMALVVAEATAEWLHELLRGEWNLDDPPNLTFDDLFKARYKGARLSFGYPACPRIEDQAGLFRLLKPEQIGVTLTEGLMMHPEASVSAVVFHSSEF